MDSPLKTTAVVIGEAAGTIASLAGSVMHRKAAAKPEAPGRFPKKHKARVPRRQKKAAAKAQKRAEAQ